MEVSGATATAACPSGRARLSRAAEVAGKEGGPKSDETGATRRTRVRAGLLANALPWCWAVLADGDPTSSSTCLQPNIVRRLYVVPNSRTGGTKCRARLGVVSSLVLTFGSTAGVSLLGVRKLPLRRPH